MAFSIKKQAGLHTINVANTNVIFINNARSDYIATVGPVLGANFSNHQRFVKIASATYQIPGSGAYIVYYNGFWKLVYDDGYNTDVVIGDPFSGNPNFILPDWGESIDGPVTITTTLDLIIKKNTTFKISAF